MKCITLTLNPAFDRHCFVPDFSLYREHLAESDTCEAGGKGVNIARALRRNGIDSLAVVVLGKENEASFKAALAHDGIRFASLSVDGRVRENLTIHTNGPETRVSFGGFHADDGLLDGVYEIIEKGLDAETILTFTGRAPRGVSFKAIIAFLERVRRTGAKIVIDSKSFASLDDLIAARPWLIKPNEEEISAYLGRPIKAHEELFAVAEEIRARGVENVMVSLGEKGAMLASAEGIDVATPPRINPVSTIGAGDSAIGGLIAAEAKGLSKGDALCLSVAYGTAACLSAGTQPPCPHDVEAILKEIKIEHFTK